MFRALFFGLSGMAAVTALLLAACSPGKPGAAVDTGLYTVKSAYAAAQTAAVAYARLPRCSATVVIACSKQSIVDDLVRLDEDARQKLDQADLTASMLAVLVFSSKVTNASMETRQ
jgi:hypothetical protein